MSGKLALRLKTAGLQGSGNGLGAGIGGGGGKKITRQAFGIHVGNLPPTTIWGDYSQSANTNYNQVPIPDIGIGSIRLWDSDGCSWRNIERTQGVFSWGRLDNALAKADEKGLDIVYTLGCGPDWATVLPGQYAGLHAGYNPHPPINDTVWINWCAAIANKLIGRGVKYEVWNEVNDQVYGASFVGSGFIGSAALLVHLTQLARQTILAIDPTAKILSANFVGQDGIQNGPPDSVTLDAYLAAGGANYCDIISIHAYNTLPIWTRPEGVIEMGKRVFDTLAKYNVTKPVWNTEWGYGTWRDETGSFHPRPGGLGFNPVIDVAPSALQTSNTITVSEASAVSVNGGTYSKNGGAHTSTPGSVVADDTLSVQHTSSAGPLSKVSTTLILGSTSTVYTTTTAAEGVTPNPIALPTNNQMPDDIARMYVTRMLILSWCVGFDRFYFYALDGVKSYSSIVMVNPATALGASTLQAAAIAYKYFSDLFTNGYISELQSLTAGGKLYYSANFTLANRKRGVIYWCDNYDTAVVSIAGAKSGTDNVGNPIDVSSGTLTVTGTPKIIYY